jgi:hypothetical protein
MRISAVVLAVLLAWSCGSGQSLNSVCLSSDGSALVQLFAGPGSGIAIDSLVLVGGTCDSANYRVYVAGVPMALALRGVKLDTCNLHVLVANGALFDSVINYCAILGVAPSAASVTPAPPSVSPRLVMPVAGRVPAARPGVVRFGLDGSRLQSGVKAAAAGVCVESVK